MTYLLIDGYNLLGSTKENMEKERDELIGELSRYGLENDCRITVVFDGWKDGMPVESRTIHNHVIIIYSRLGEKADSVIKRIIGERKKRWIVVSSDRELIRNALNNECVSLTSFEFNRILFNADVRSAKEDVRAVYEIDDDEYDNRRTKKKGNPHRLSKKERDKLKVIKKLNKFL
jgi:hypothetical protein